MADTVVGALIVELRANAASFHTELGRARRNFRDTGAAATQFGGHDVREATQNLRIFGDAILGNINPSLRGLITGISQAGREARTFGVLAAGLTVGAVAVVASFGAL